MSAPTLERHAPVRPRSGRPGRTAMRRWAWRLFRREWRQQLLILALLIVAVAAVVVGSAVATDTPRPATSTFGTAQDLAVLDGTSPQLASQIASLEHRFGAADVIEDETLKVPGSTQTYVLRAEPAHGHFDHPLLSLLSGHFPVGAAQVAMTPALVTELGLRVGSVWHEGGLARRVVGLVQNPDSLLDEFALVVPGQVPHPTSVTVLFDAHGVPPGHIGPEVRSATGRVTSNVLNPTTIVLALATVGMLLIALVSVGGFTVVAQRRLRAIGMVESLGATDRHVRSVVRMNGAVVGAVGAAVGLVVGLVAWLAYRPTVEADAHHVIGTFALPWDVIAPAMALAVLAALFAASRPARAITRIPVVAALSGRPAPPRKVRRSAVPAVVVLVASFVLFGLASGNRSKLALVAAFIVLIAGVVLVAPFFLSVLARVGRGAPVAVRLALRDLGRYRARSGSALAAISLGVLIAVVISVIAAGRYGNVLDYAGPNLASNQLIVYVTGIGPGTRPQAPPPPPTKAQLAAMGRVARRIAASVGATGAVKLESTSATLQHAGPGRQFSGQVYVATPQLLRAFGIAPSSVDPTADVVTSRPGLATVSKLSLVYGGSFTPAQGGPPGPGTTAASMHPVIQELGSLPTGTSAPNTLVTEHAVTQLHLHPSPTAWFIQGTSAFSASQIADAKLLAATQHMRVETRSSAPSSAEVVDWATVFGIALALGILAMSVGLIRSETAGDLRTLAATGAGSRTRRTLTAATAGGLGLLGAVVGTACGYIACIGWYRSTHLTGMAALSHTPVANLLLLLVGMPVAATVIGWLLSGREPAAMAHQPIE